MGKIIRNGLDYSGLINVDGVFIDTDNVIQTDTSTGSFSYVASSDCYIGMYLIPNGDCSIKINNKTLSSIYSTSIIGFPFGCYLRKGQTLSVSGLTTSYESSYRVYGLQVGTTHSTPDYSTTEHKTGRRWIDGRDIYEITFDVSANPITLTNNWSTVSALAGVDFIVSATASCGGCIEGAVEVQYSGGNVIIERIGLNSGDTRNLTYLTIQYVKT